MVPVNDLPLYRTVVSGVHTGFLFLLVLLLTTSATHERPGLKTIAKYGPEKRASKVGTLRG